MAWQTTMRRVLALMRGSGDERRAEGEGEKTQPQPVREQVALGAQEPPLTQEDWYWGGRRREPRRISSGGGFRITGR